jgi:hypothetical protein
MKHHCKALVSSLTAWAFFVSSVIAPLASQNSLFSPTTGTVSGLALTYSYNNALDSLNTGNSGATAPVNQLSGLASLGNIWINTTSIPYPWQVYDGASWLSPFWIDATNHTTDVKIGGGAATVASAATVDLCGSAIAPQAYITISGTTTITSFGSTCKAGHVKLITFSGILTLTYNASSLIIPGAANVTTAAGDQAVVVALGSGNWQVMSYTPASGAALINPAIDVGDYVLTAAIATPSSKYLFAYGQAISRTTYSVLLGLVTITQSVTRTNGSPTLTGFSDTTQIPTGAAIEGSGIPTSTTISSCTSTTCTMSANASSSGTANVTIFPYGDGDGSTTFNLPNCQGVTLAGRDNMSGTPRGLLTASVFGTNPDALGGLGGAQAYALPQSALPNVTINIPSGQGSHTHGVTGGTIGGSSTFTPNLAGGSNPAYPTPPTTISISAATLPAMATASINGGVTQTNYPAVQPTIIANCMIRVLAKLEAVPGELPRAVAANDDLPIADRRRAA